MCAQQYVPCLYGEKKMEKFRSRHFLTSGAGELAGKPKFGLCGGEAGTAVLALAWCSPRD